MGEPGVVIKEEENINEIQSYLATFNKEIEGGDRNNASTSQTIVTTSAGSDNEATEGAYYVVDQSGNYYYQAAEDEEASNGDILATQGEEDEGTVVSIPGSGEGNSNDEMVLSGDGYQTVAIVPSESNSGEVSYVLIVQPEGEGGSQDGETTDILSLQENGDEVEEGNEEDGGDDQNLAVYDFDEGEEGGLVAQAESSDEVEEKVKVTKAPPKKSQTVTQAHMCNYCNYTSPKRYLLSRHMKSHSEERPHKCSVCDRGFKTLASLQNHVNTHTGTKPHRCKFCLSSFTTSGELVRHVRYRHTHEKPHRCTECDYASVELSKLKRHMRCHTGERPYQCPHCTYASPDTFKLKRHLRIHTGEKPYECDICQARFTQSNSLKAHRLIHTGNKPVFQCELCPTTCGRKTDLRIHVQKLHTSDRPLKCKRCGKGFPDRYSFKLHSKSHEGEKCFKCDLCPYASISQRHLESHMLIHTDQKPYQCDQCDQSFRQKQLLKRHQNLYHNPEYIPPPPGEKTHECSECNKPFRHKGNLIRHLAMHDPNAAQEQLKLLKSSKRKKIQLVEGQQVDGFTEGEEDEDEDDEPETDTDGEIMAVQGQDGQQYVVLEVIHLQEGEGEDGVTMLAAEDDIDEASEALVGLQEDYSQDASLDEEMDDGEIPRRRSEPGTVAEDSQKDMETCFGFDDEEDEEEDE